MESRSEGKAAGILWIVLCVQAVLHGLMLFLGNAPRLFAEQPAWFLGLVLSGYEDPDGFLFVLHAAGSFVLGMTLWMWWQAHAWLKRFLVATIIGQILLSPLGLAVAALLIWFMRKTDWRAEIEAQQGLSGRALGEVLVVWIGASAIMFAASVPTFVLLEMNPLFWPGAMLLCALPQTGAFLWLHRRASKADTHILAPMPRLPDADH